MTESCSESLLGTWAPAECPFKISYSLRALDDIRLAVMDAFFSLPRGGAEIGGILLGKRDGQQVTILDHVALDCEHAFGPSFTLSPKDLAHLSILLEEAKKNSPDLQPAGWYHSHTRSEIFLSDADLEIQRRYFAAPWQVALVLKPHTFYPMRAGFFFREADGSFHSAATYQEITLDPQPIRQLPTGAIPPPGDNGQMRLDHAPTGRVITMPVTVVPESPTEQGSILDGANGSSAEHDTAPSLTAVPSSPEPVAAPESGGAAAPVSVPDSPVSVPDSPVDTPLRSLQVAPRRRLRFAPLVVLAALLAIGFFGWETRQAWLPRIWHGATASNQPTAINSLGLVLTDHEGELQITWDRKLPAVVSASRAMLEISSGGGLPTAVKLDAAQLQNGSYTFKRDTDRVDVILSLEGADGELGRESAGFLGKLPEALQVASKSATASGTAKERNALAVEVEKLKGENRTLAAKNQQLLKYMDQRGDVVSEAERLRNLLNAEVARNRDLERAVKPKDDQIAKLRSDLNTQISHNRVLAQALDEAQAQLKLQQKKRLSNQAPDTSK